MRIVVVGGGPAGRISSIEAAQLEAEVTLVEKEYIGGKCLNYGCMVIAGLNDVARFMKDAQKFNELNIIPKIDNINYKSLTNGIKTIQSKIRHVEENETHESGVEILNGTAEKIDESNKEIIVNGESLRFDKLIMTTGSRAFIPPINGYENAKTFRDMLNFKELPANLIIVGGGVIAAEIAGVFSALGSQAHILCKNSFLGILDDDVKDYVTRKLLDNVEIHENLIINEIRDDGIVTDNGSMYGDVLLATGMIPNSELLTGIVNIGDNGEVLVNHKMETSAKDIYAAGDLVGGIGTTPVARMEGVVAARNACGITAKADYTFIPNAISLYHDVGFISNNNSMTNDENIFEASIPGFAGPGSFWRVLDGNTGFTKVKVDKKFGEIRDVSSISPSARTSMAYISKMMRENYKVYDFDNFMETHPSTDPIYKLMRHFSTWTE